MALKNYIKKGIPPSQTDYIRACLGIANELIVGKDCMALIEHCSRNDDEKIERYQSPIIFKIFDQNIFVLYRDTFDFVSNETFKFSFVDKDTKKRVLYPPQTLIVPQKFDVEKFLTIYLKDGYKKIEL